MKIRYKKTAIDDIQETRRYISEMLHNKFGAPVLISPPAANAAGGLLPAAAYGITITEKAKKWGPQYADGGIH